MFLLISSTCLCQSGKSKIFYWTGIVSDAWDDSDNWTPAESRFIGSTPATAAEAIIGPSSLNPVIDTTPTHQEIRVLTIQDGGRLTIENAASLIVSHMVNIEQGGTLIVEGTLEINAAASFTVNGSLSGNGTLTISGMVDASISGTATATIRTLAVNSSKTLTVSSGTLTVNDTATINGSVTIETGGSLVSMTTLTISSGGLATVNRNGNLEMSEVSGSTSSTTLTVNGTLSGGGTLTISGMVEANIPGTATINALTVDSSTSLTVSSGTLTVDDTATINGSVAIETGGLLSSIPTLTINSGGSLSTVHNLTINSGESATVHGNLEMSEVSGSTSSTTLTVNGTLSGDGTLTISGMVEASIPGTATATIHTLAVDSSKTLTVSLGTLTVDDTATINGSVTIETGGSLVSMTTLTINSGGLATVNRNGNLEMSEVSRATSPTTLTVNGTLSGDGTLTISGMVDARISGTATATIRTLAVNSSTSLTVFSGTLTVNDTATINGSVTIETGGELSDIGTLTINSGGSITVNATKSLRKVTTLTINSGGSATVNSVSSLSTISMLTINSGGTFSTVSNVLVLVRGTIDGTLEMSRSDTSLQTFLATGSVSGTGSITISASEARIGGSVSINALTVDSSKTLTVFSGTLTVNDTATINGSVAIETGGSLSSIPTLTINSGGSLSTVHNLTINSGESATVHGNLEMSEVSGSTSSTTLTVNGTLSGNGTLTISGMVDASISGTATINALTVDSSTSLTVSSGTLTVDDTATINGSVAIETGGSLSSIPTLTINSGGSLSTVHNLTINSGGSATVSGNLEMSEVSGSTSSTTLTVNGTLSGNGTLTISGTVDASISGTATINALTVDSSTSLTVSSGTLTVDDTATINGSVAIETGGSLSSIPTLTINSGGSLSTVHDLTINPGGSATVHGNLEMSEVSGSTSSTTLTVNGTLSGNGTLTISGMVDASISGTATINALTVDSSTSLTVFSGTLTVDDTATINGSVTIETGGLLSSIPTLTINSGGSLSTVHDLTINSGGSATVSGNLEMSEVSEATSPTTLTVNGTLSGNGTLTISGMVDASISGTATIHSLTVNSSKTLTVSLGTLSINDDLTINSGGKLKVDSTLKMAAATVTINGTLDGTGTLELTATTTTEFFISGTLDLSTLNRYDITDIKQYTFSFNALTDSSAAELRTNGQKLPKLNHVQGNLILTGDSTWTDTFTKTSEGSLTVKEGSIYNKDIDSYTLFTNSSVNFEGDVTFVHEVNSDLVFSQIIVNTSGTVRIKNTTPDKVQIHKADGPGSLTLNVMGKTTGYVFGMDNPLNKIEIVSAGVTDFQNTINAASIIQADTAGDITFSDDVTTTASSNFNGNVNLDTMTFTVNNNLTFGNGNDILSISGDVGISSITDGVIVDLINVNVVPDPLQKGNFTVAVEGDNTKIKAGANGNTTDAFREINFQASTITLQSNMYSSEDQTYSSDNGTYLKCTRDCVINAQDRSVTFNDLYINTNMEIDFKYTDTIETNLFVFYSGSLESDSGIKLNAQEDIVIFGNNYNDDHPDSARSNEWMYPSMASLNGDPGIGSYNASFTDNALSGADIRGGENFYVNGTDINPGSTWNLTLPNSIPSLVSTSSVLTDSDYYAIILNARVRNSIVESNTVITAYTENMGINSVTNSGNNTEFSYSAAVDSEFIAGSERDLIEQISSYGYDFYPLLITAAETVQTNRIKISFNKPVLNIRNSIVDNIGDISVFDTDTKSAVPFELALVNRNSGIYEIDTSVYALTTLYLQLPNGQNWRGDATGSKHPNAVMDGLGSMTSTDNLGRISTIVPDIRIEHGALRGFSYTDFAIVSTTSTSFTDTADKTSPVLYAIFVGRANEETSDARSAHNYFRLRYSEPVSFGTNPALAYTVADQNTFQEASMYGFNSALGGGEIHDANGTIIVNGLFQYSNNDYRNAGSDYYMRKGCVFSSCGNFEDPIDLLLKPSTNELEIYLAARQDGEQWVGWFFNALDPSAAETLEVLQNSNIVDRNSNILDHIQSNAILNNTENFFTFARKEVATHFTPDPDVTDAYRFWDVSPPGISTYVTDEEIDPDFGRYPPQYHEILAKDTNDTNIIDRMEFFIQDNIFSRSWDFFTGEDNSQNPGSWDPTTRTRNITVPRGTVPRGIRDNSLSDLLAFRVADISTPVASTNSSSITQFNTDVANSLYGNHSEKNDPYFSLIVDETMAKFTHETTDMYVTYDAAIGHLTDLAGNLMPSSGYKPESVFTSAANPSLYHPNRFVQIPYENNHGRFIVIERRPPSMQLVLSAVGGNRIYIKFDEPVFGNRNRTEAIDSKTFKINDDSNIINVTGIESLAFDDNSTLKGVTEAYLKLETELTADQLYNAKIIVADDNSLWDRFENNYPDGTMRRITDVLIGVITPVWATDGIQQDDTKGGGFSSLRVFNGTGKLNNLDITVESTVTPELSSSYLPSNIQLHFDLMSQSGILVLDDTGFWSAIEIPGLIEKSDVNNTASTAQILSRTGHTVQHLIPQDDRYETNVNTSLQFLYTVNCNSGINCVSDNPSESIAVAWSEDPNDPLNLLPWSIQLDEILSQRGGVTVTNNVINPSAGDEALIQYELKETGVVTIYVLTLTGDLVKTISNDSTSKGKHMISWDGTNSSNEAVASGFYFIRMISPEFDEIRKILVVRK